MSYVSACLMLSLFSPLSSAEVTHRETNNGNLVMEDIPAIPQSVVTSLNRYQNVRSAGFLDWTEAGDGIFISTRFGDVSQIHRVDHAGGPEGQARPSFSSTYQMWISKLGAAVIRPNVCG